MMVCGGGECVDLLGSKVHREWPPCCWKVSVNSSIDVF